MRAQPCLHGKGETARCVLLGCYCNVASHTLRAHALLGRSAYRSSCILAGKQAEAPDPCMYQSLVRETQLN
jgi:hypothetical protein